MHWHRGLVALSADPITHGHLDLIDQALACCDEIVVLITVNLEKEERYLFTLEERGGMAAHAISEKFGQLDRLRVICGRYRVVEVYTAQECDVLLRGLRTEEERTHEESVLQSFIEEAPNLVTQLIVSRPAFVHISSTEAKRAATQSIEHALNYVTREVALELSKKLQPKGDTSMAVGQYRLVERLAEGHFSFGYRGIHTVLGTEVFIKQARKTDAATREVFVREAKILGTITIPGVPALREYLETPVADTPDVPCIIMELVPGVTCHTLVKKGPYDTKKTLWLLYRAVSILHKLHTRYQTAHCDVGPDNIMIDETDGYGSVNLIDFGLATLVNGKFAARYWNNDAPPPEFLAGKPVTPAADYYSLGMLGRFLLMGGVNQEPLPATLPAEVRQLITELINPEPGLRLQDYDELRTRIEQIQKHI